MEKIPDIQDKLNFKTKNNLSIFLGMPLDTLLQPDNVLLLQKATGATAGPAAGGIARNIRISNLTKSKSMKNELTTVQRLTS
jgi:hypothetical protein